MTSLFKPSLFLDALSKQSLLGLIKLYRVIKPVWHAVALSFFGVTPTCRFDESCSHYTARMIQTHGTISGLKYGLHRVMRCWRF